MGCLSSLSWVPSNDERMELIMKEKQRCDTPEKARAASSNVWNSFLTEIREKCLEQNFGTLSKSEFDLLLFHYYLLDRQEKAAGKYVTDYEIGRDLGLTIQRVRSLREREALKWRLQENYWRESFLACLKHARYDEKSGAVKIPVPDVNVIKEVRNYLERAGLFDDYQLNPKVFQCNLDVLIAICLDMKLGCDDNLCTQILDKLRGSKDGKVVCAVKRLEHPVQAYLKMTVVKGVQGTIELIPGAGKVCGELFAKLFED